MVCIELISRGVYSWPGGDLGENQTLAEAARQIPRRINSLLFGLDLCDIKCILCRTKLLRGGTHGSPGSSLADLGDSPAGRAVGDLSRVSGCPGRIFWASRMPRGRR